MRFLFEANYDITQREVYDIHGDFCGYLGDEDHGIYKIYEGGENEQYVIIDKEIYRTLKKENARLRKKVKKLKAQLYSGPRNK